MQGPRLIPTQSTALDLNLSIPSTKGQRTRRNSFLTSGRLGRTCQMSSPSRSVRKKRSSQRERHANFHRGFAGGKRTQKVQKTRKRGGRATGREEVEDDLILAKGVWFSLWLSTSTKSSWKRVRLEQQGTRGEGEKSVEACRTCQITRSNYSRRVEPRLHSSERNQSQFNFLLFSRSLSLSSSFTFFSSSQPSLHFYSYTETPLLLSLSTHTSTDPNKPPTFH